MSDDLFYCNVDGGYSQLVADVIDELSQYSSQNQLRVYVLNAPLEFKEAYNSPDCFAIAIPNRKIAFVSAGESAAFDTFCDDFLEDIGILSSKYGYVKKLGRPREWKDGLFAKIDASSNQPFMSAFLELTELSGRKDRRLSTLITSLIIGSINDIDNLNIEVENTVIDYVKQKIVLFDGQQSRFIYENRNKSRIVIQGMAGTGKTELLLHKLRELYTSHPDGKSYTIFFTCHNKVLANSMRKRITSFFNYMKVDEQIEWGKRLHVARSWGSQSNPESGLYSFICSKYGSPFYAYRDKASFDAVCRLALDDIPQGAPPCLDYILVDESQDFPESFFALCERVTTEKVFIAGDVFQDIYEERHDNHLDVDYLLSNCYRTDPRTLLFAHALGLGLCEEPVIQWLDDGTWKSCGYVVNDVGGQEVSIQRHPINRFGLEGDDGIGGLPQSIVMRGTDDFVAEVLNIVLEIKSVHRTVNPGDIAIVFPGSGQRNYAIADEISVELKRRFNWNSIIGYEKKCTDEDSVFISNRNNIKGLEFPFVICFVIGGIERNLALRNALYMILTRSFLSSYLVFNQDCPEPIGRYERLAERLVDHSDIVVRKPTAKEVMEQRENVTTLLAEKRAKSLDEIVEDCLSESELEGVSMREAKMRLMDFFKSDSGDYDSDALREKVTQAISLLIPML